MTSTGYIQTDWFENIGFLQTDWFEAILDNDIRDFPQKIGFITTKFMVQFHGLTVQNVCPIKEVRMISKSKTMNQVRHAPNLDMFCGGIKKD